MMTQTTLSDARPPRRVGITLRRFPFILAADSSGLAREILIANPRLEFRLSHRKISILKISNREEIAIFLRFFAFTNHAARISQERPQQPNSPFTNHAVSNILWRD
jgi:hypothetical protein